MNKFFIHHALTDNIHPKLLDNYNKLLISYFLFSFNISH